MSSVSAIALIDITRMAPRFVMPTSFIFILLVWVSSSIASSNAAILGRDKGDWEAPLLPASKQQWPLIQDVSSGRDASITMSDEQDTISNSSMSYSALLEALHVMESHFFSVSQGTWPDAIDWTAAVMGTQVSASLNAMSEHDRLEDVATEHVLSHENIINRYFTQLAAFYFGEDAFSLRTQAYDDMLWVVLGWIESIKFINTHSRLHYSHCQSTDGSSNHTSSWYAQQFIPQFAHRSRLFYDLASKGWDTTLCGGGMIWNPHLAPYKNAITNQLFIAASVSMYLYFPGDDNPSPFAPPGYGTNFNDARSGNAGEKLPPAEAHDERYMQIAIEAYEWLKNSGMRNKAGLYVDGFHVSGWRGGRHGSNGTERCDVRDETVYTYNQGVILTALRGLWEATGKISYLEDGHELINDVIKATGWENRDSDWKYHWAGLGRNGIMEEICDWSGMCSQDGQTFKGIFWHHFAVFCSPLPTDDDYYDGNDINRVKAKLDRPWLRNEETRVLHQQSCDGYGAWIKTNARAAWVTSDDNGEFGAWWGRPWPGRERHSGIDDNDHGDDGKGADSKIYAPLKEDGSVDYRNEGVPIDNIWRLSITDNTASIRSPYGTPVRTTEDMRDAGAEKWDLNDRGRGRTVETQSGGVAVIRALWKLVECRRQQSSED